MAGATTLDVVVNVAVSDDTLGKCLMICEMWLKDHPELNIVFEERDGERKGLIDISGGRK